MSHDKPTSKSPRLPKTRRLLASFPGARSAWHLGRTLKDVWLDSSTYSQVELREEFSRSDPWRYTTNQLEILRHRGELTMLDRVIGETPFHSALELGCAEGIFTEYLADRCDSLLAMDFNEVALERAQNRLRSYQHVHFRSLDLRKESIPGVYDLVCAVHVLEYIQSPFPLWKVREKIVGAIKPGGYLLLGCVSFDSPVDKSWWSRFLLRGGKQITAFFAAHPQLNTIETAIHPLTVCNSIDILFRKTQ